MKNIEIPHVHERGFSYRLFEILPGALSWSILILPFVLSIFYPIAIIFFIIAYLLLWFLKAIGLNLRSIQGFSNLNKQVKFPWPQMLVELESGNAVPSKDIPSWHHEQIKRIKEHPVAIKPSEIIHAIIIATYNESIEVLEPTFKAVRDSNYDSKRVILVLAFEERGGADVERNAKLLIKKYKSDFMHAMAVKHPKDMPGEVIGKGGNITFAGRELNKYVQSVELDPLKVIVTTLDSDNRPHSMYLPALSYVYSLTKDPQHVSYQPIPVFTSNIWDVPAPMRIIATGNTFWNIVLSLRPHMIRNFASHAQCLQTLIDTDFWSVRTIVEDGHQFWRTYFAYDGKHEVYPIYIPIYQDAVLSTSLWKTFKAQFIQLRRWAWGASDIAYVAEKGYFTKNKVPKIDLTFKFMRLLEGHVSWATASLILAFSAFIPAFFNSDNYAAVQLPIVASNIQRVALGGILLTMFLSLKLLPPKPERYGWPRIVAMVIQWPILPVTTILFNTLAAINSQTRLMFGWYLGMFDVTDKAVVTDEEGKKI